MRKRSLLLVAGACLAAFTLTVSSAVADPSGPPTFRDLAGGGEEITQALMNGLSDVITIGGTKVIGSYNVRGSATITTKAPPANCTINRPISGPAAVLALFNSQEAGDGCLQFAGVDVNDSANLPGRNLTYIPYARDAVPFIIRDDSSIPSSLTTQQLRDLYTCTIDGFNPLLYSFGSRTRALFLTSIGLTDSANFTTLNPCVTDGVPAHQGNQLTNANQISPHSVSQFLSQKSGLVPDNTGRTKLGRINGISPAIVSNVATIQGDIYNVVPNSLVGTEPTNAVFVGPSSRGPDSGGHGIFLLVGSQIVGDGCLQFARQDSNDHASRPGTNLTYIPYARDALSFVIRDDSPLPRFLALGQLFDLYNCTTAGFNPLLGPFGSGTRRTFLHTIGHTDTLNFTTLHPCVTDGVPENGNLLTNANQIASHSVAQFLSQKNAVAPDNTGRAQLGRIDGISAAVVNNAVTIPRDIYNVVPNALVGVAPASTVFVGPGSLICQNSATIQRFSFGTHPDCGSTALTTP